MQMAPERTCEFDPGTDSGGSFSHSLRGVDVKKPAALEGSSRVQVRESMAGGQLAQKWSNSKSGERLLACLHEAGWALEQKRLIMMA